LRNAAKKYRLRKFIGVFPSDYPIKLREGHKCILNTMPSGSSGEHWVALCKYKGSVYIFDSYDRDYKTLSPFWINKKWKQPHIGKTLEAKKDNDCGQRCISFLLLVDMYKDVDLIFEALK
jgi:hypothetical protein